MNHETAALPGQRAVMRREMIAKAVEHERATNGDRAADRLERRMFAEAEGADLRDRERHGR